MSVPVLSSRSLAPQDWPLARAAGLPPALRDRIEHVALRVPPRDDAARWQSLQLPERQHVLARPITLTPYASVRPCSARCGFCSENLRLANAGPAASSLRPGSGYFDGLAAMLGALRGVELSWSLSGLENTDDADWLLRLLDTLAAAERGGVQVEQRVLYSNGAGLARDADDALADALARFGLSWIELSRHHFDPDHNQRLMRFRDGEAVRTADAFEQAVRRCAARFPVRLVCLVQRDGVDGADAMLAYLHRARTLGVREVVFRELSRLPASYRVNGTLRHVEHQRVAVDALATAMFAADATLQPLRLTEGYYFWNLVARWRDAIDVTFECADYAVMHAQHASDRVYKLVYFANGELCAGWQPGQQVLWRASARDDRSP